MDDEAAFPVLEAVLVAILVLTAVLFFTSFGRPTAATDEGGIDLGRYAADALAVMGRHSFDDPTGSPLTEEGWLTLLVQGNTAMAGEVEAYLGEILPPGTRFALRLDNGVEPLHLVPQGVEDAPRAARAAETYIAPDWRARPGPFAQPVQQVHPGQEITAAPANATAFRDLTPGGCVEAPDGSASGPAGPWLSVWRGSAQVPSAVPYGVWAAHTGACDDTPDVLLRVGLPDGTAADFPVYGLQLVVWFGA